MMKKTASTGKTAIAISNNKGGVGKTTLAVMLSETALLRTDKKIHCVDLDPQKNFIDTLSLIDQAKYAGRLTVSEKISFKGDINIIDCPPEMSQDTISAIKMADSVLIPIMADMYSLVNIEKIFSVGKTQGKTLKQMPLISVGFNVASASILAEITSYIAQNEFVIGAEIPSHKLIPFNIMTGQMWEYGLSTKHRHILYKLLDRILGGDFE
jgi:cellulose biosynthesis protein BcsQ